MIALTKCSPGRRCTQLIDVQYRLSISMGSTSGETVSSPPLPILCIHDPPGVSNRPSLAWPRMSKSDIPAFNHKKHFLPCLQHLRQVSGQKPYGSTKFKQKLCLTCDMAYESYANIPRSYQSTFYIPGTVAIPLLSLLPLASECLFLYCRPCWIIPPLGNIDRSVLRICRIQRHHVYRAGGRRSRICDWCRGGLGVALSTSNKSCYSTNIFRTDKTLQFHPLVHPQWD